MRQKSRAGQVHKPTDSVGRVRRYSDERLEAADFAAACLSLDTEAAATGATRWSMRGLVSRIARTDDLLPGLDSAGGPLEVNRLPAWQPGADEEPLDYLWVSRNHGGRVPPRQEQLAFLRSVEKRLTQEALLQRDFTSEAERLLSNAERRGWSVVCNDPFGNWGMGGLDSLMFSALLQQLFWFDGTDAARVAVGAGYSTKGHYTFALQDSAGQSLCFFVLAKFGWGFEGTYTMVNPTAPAEELNGAARTLMLVANALVISRYGDDVLLYGEANARNVPACLSAGYRLLPPRGIAEQEAVHHNVVWADNPIGPVDTVSRLEERVQPPDHASAEYINYALMRAANEVVSPYAKRALALLRQ